MLSPNQSHVVFDRFGSYRQDVYPPSLVSSGRSRTRLRIRGIVGAVPTINTTLGACEGLDVVWLH